MRLLMKPLCALSFLVSTAGLLSGCGGGGQSSGPVGGAGPAQTATGRVTFTVQWPAASRLVPVDAKRIEVVLRAAPGEPEAGTEVDRDSVTLPATTILFNNVPAIKVVATATAFPDAAGAALASGSVEFTVTPRPPGSTDADTVELTMNSEVARLEAPETTIPVGVPVKLTATARNTANQVVLVGSKFEWTIVTPGGDQFLTLTTDGTATGKIPTPALPTPTPVEVKVRDLESGKEITTRVTVRANIEITPASPTVPQGGTQQFTATVPGPLAIIWSVDPPDPNGPDAGKNPGTIDQNGLYTAPLNSGTFFVRATSAAEPTNTAAVPVIIPPVTIVAEPAEVTVEQDGQREIMTTVQGANLNEVTWAITAVTPPGAPPATLNPVSATKATFNAPRTGLSVDAVYTVTATSATDASVTKDIRVTVPAIRIAVTPVADAATGKYPVQSVRTRFKAAVTGVVNKNVQWTLFRPNRSGTDVTALFLEGPTDDVTEVTFRADATAAGDFELVATSKADAARSAALPLDVKTGSVSGTVR